MTQAATVPVRLPDNRVPDVYAGGARIDAFRSQAVVGEGPEDWVGSLTLASEGMRARLGRPRLGLSSTEDGAVLKELAATDPLAWLGRASTEDVDLLVKLLDAGERLPVHYHPTTAFATRHLGVSHGKTEAWVVVDADSDAAVWLGFREPVTRSLARGWVDTQDESALVDALNRISVQQGDVFFVPAGVPHAIGAGIMIVEVQQPSSLSILLEHQRFGVAEHDAHLGVGWELALESLDCRGLSPALGSRLRPKSLARYGAGGVHDLLAPEADQFFRMQRVSGDCQLELHASHGVLIVLAGTGVMRCRGGTTPIDAGGTWFVPNAASPVSVSGRLDALLCQGGTGS